MHGTLRFILAALVIYSHLGQNILQLNPGICAVVVFYMLSGFVVTHLRFKYFPPEQPGSLRGFYTERFLRIYPLYFVLLLVAGVFLFATGYKQPYLSAGNILSNLLIIPLNYYMFTDGTLFASTVMAAPMELRPRCVLPPAWSLGAELQAYLLLPLILHSERLKWVFGSLSLGVFLLATCGIINGEIWGYRLLPGTLFFFLVGACLCKTVRYRDTCDKFDSLFPKLAWGGVAWGLLLIVAVRYFINQRLDHYTAEGIVGFLIGFPVVRWLYGMPERQAKSLHIPFDKEMGNLSYGVYLIHFPIIWFLDWLQWKLPVIGQFLLVLVLSTLISVLASGTIERAVWPLRQGMTQSPKKSANML
jgi:peptidoglycan/LPS O-acetylase OafA/YrhL